MTVAFFLLFALGTICWLATVATAASLNSSDQAGNGMSYGFAMIGVIVTWSTLALLLLFAFNRISAPGWITALAILSVPLSAAAAVTVVNLLKDNRDFIGQWPLVTVVVVPLLILLFALWAVVPAVQAMASREVVLPAVWMAVLLLAVIPFPLRAVQKTRQARERQAFTTTVNNAEAEEHAAWRARFDAVHADAHLRDVLAFTTNGSNMRDEALARARTLPARQQNALEMMNRNEGAVMSELRNLALEHTAELCTEATEFLRRHAVDSRSRVSSDNGRFIVAAQELDKYIFGMQWLAERGCAVNEATAAYRETANLYPDSPERAEFLSRLELFGTTAANAPPRAS
ncbi:MAG: hypothetical protein H7Z40_01650 [Phycisphaerae bacterium]|nr:hypothetical protein [Gemmatimonadaceae bacterium]